MKLSKREKEVLEMLLTSADDGVAALNLGIRNPKQIAVHRTNVRRKIVNAQKFAKETLKKYRSVLYPEKHYKGIHTGSEQGGEVDEWKDIC